MKKLIKVISIVLTVMLIPISAFAEEDINLPEQTIYIYQGENDVTGKTVDIRAAAINSQANTTKAVLMAKDSDGNLLNDVKWTSDNGDYVSLVEENSNCTVSALSLIHI